MGVTTWMVLALLGCGGGDASAPVEADAPAEAAKPAEAAASKVATHLSAREAWIRLMPPGSHNTAGFMVLENTGTAPLEVVSASANIARSVELHTHIEEDGRMKMRRLEKLTVAPAATVKLEKGGHHVMFIGLSADLTEAQEVPVTLTLSDGSELEVTMPVQREAPGAEAPVEH